MTEPLACQRALFSLNGEDCWLNSAYMGPLPVPTQQAGAEALARRAFPVGIVPRDFFAPADRVRALCAQLVNADPETVALVPTVAYGMAIVARNLRPRRGQNVVLLGEQFPSNVYPWRDWREDGVELRMVAAPEAPWSSPQSNSSRAARWNEALLAAIDADTALVAVEQAHWTDGTLFDLERIGTRAREVGAAFIIDGTQTVGAMPLDVAAIRPDALIVHSYKAMLCNYGLGFAVLGPRFAGGVPVEESWLTRHGSENFARLVDYQDAYAHGARRHDSSIRANPILIGMLEASCRLLVDWQPARIRAYLLGIERDFVARVRALGFDVADEAERAANIFGIRLPEGLDPETVRSALAARRIHVSVRGSAVRVSPHVYNDEADLARLADALQALR
ncbi:MAG: aminotransferase class V-fold PLP-dependent enzyme [Geminicoccaceae bacterium]